jgi:hypothetical protein
MLSGNRILMDAQSDEEPMPTQRQVTGINHQSDTDSGINLSARHLIKLLAHNDVRIYTHDMR